MFEQQINQAVNDLSQLAEMQAADLKIAVERYPWCQITQVLYVKKLAELKSPSFERQLQKTAAMIFDRRVLFELIEKTSLQKNVLSGFEHDEEVVPEQNKSDEM